MQKIQLDSLHVLLRQATNDTLQMDAYRRLGFYYAEIDRDSALYFGEQQLRLAKKLKQRFWEALALSHIGYVNFKLENYPIAIKYFFKAQEILEDVETEENIWGLLENESPKHARLRWLSGVLINLSILNGAIGNLDKQIVLFNKAYNYAYSIQDNLVLSVSSMNVGRVYINLNKLDSALLFEKKALHYSDKSGYTKYKGNILSIIGEVFYKKRQYSLSKKYYIHALPIAKEQQNFQSIGVIYIGLSDLFRVDNQPDSSIYYAKKGLHIFKDLRSQSGILSAYNSIYLTYKKYNNTDSSFFYLDKLIPIKDSLVKNDKEKLRQVLNISLDEQLRLEQLEKERIENQNKIRIYTLLAGIGAILIIAFILYRSNQQKRRANIRLNQQNDQIQKALNALKTTQAQLIQKEKLASLGELTAGIAHEIQNPLNFVNNFAEVSVELADELHQSVEENDKALAQSLSADLRQNMQQIVHNGQRASNIVRAMLEHSSNSTGERQATDLNGLAEEYLKLAYHGFRAKHSGFTAILKTDFAVDLPHLEVVAGDVGRVLLNLYNNAFYAVRQRQVQESSATPEPVYEPTIWVSTRLVEGQVELRVQDNGLGVAAPIQAKVFQPFFTTKPTGQGTGLGLSLSYDIITKGHGGEMWVESQEAQGAIFIIRL